MPGRSFILMKDYAPLRLYALELSQKKPGAPRPMQWIIQLRQLGASSWRVLSWRIAVYAAVTLISGFSGLTSRRWIECIAFCTFLILIYVIIWLLNLWVNCRYPDYEVEIHDWHIARSLQYHLSRDGENRSPNVDYISILKTELKGFEQWKQTRWARLLGSNIDKHEDQVI